MTITRPSRHRQRQCRPWSYCQCRQPKASHGGGDCRSGHGGQSVESRAPAGRAPRPTQGHALPGLRDGEHCLTLTISRAAAYPPLPQLRPRNRPRPSSALNAVMSATTRSPEQTMGIKRRPADTAREGWRYAAQRTGRPSELERGMQPACPKGVWLETGNATPLEGRTAHRPVHSFWHQEGRQTGFSRRPSVTQSYTRLPSLPGLIAGNVPLMTAIRSHIRPDHKSRAFHLR